MRDEQFAAVPVHIRSNPRDGCIREKRWYRKAHSRT
jgi:hypothetical protein